MSRSAIACALILVLPASIVAAGVIPECDAPGELTTYSMMSQVGTVAKCEHRDDAGALTKSVYYTTHQKAATINGPFLEDELVVQTITEFRYNDEGLLIRTDRYNREHTLSSYSTRTYDPDGRQVIDSFAADGTQRYRTIAPKESPKTVFVFDDRGASVVGIHGPLVGGLDLPDGWGDAVDGVSCGAAASDSQNPISHITVYATLRNLSPHSIDAPVGNQYWVIDLELHDSGGRTVPKNIEFIEAEMARLRRISRRDPLGGRYRPLPPGEATYWGGTIKLSEWYTDVPSGRYQLIVTRHLDEPRHDIVCNTISLTIRTDEDDEQ